MGKKTKIDWADQQALDAAEAERAARERLERWGKNKNNPTRPAKWKRDWDYIGECETGAMPFRPNCNEPLYETGQCYFCGQRIENDTQMQEFNTPPDEKRMDCFMCGEKDSIIYTESKYNGHKRGHCEKCGIQFIE